MHPHRLARAASLIPLLLLLGVAPEDPVDVVAYGDHVPVYFASPTGALVPFVTPFEDVPPLGDPPTRFRLAVVPGIGLPRGTSPWGHTSWSKYVLVGNYDEKNGGVFQVIDDQRIGVYDTETRTFCQIDLTPGDPGTTNASVQWLAVASPTAKQTRIYFAGYTHGPGYTFGYLEADSENPNPCDPASGWNVVGFTGPQLNAAVVAGASPACVGTCGWDGMDVLDADTVVLGNWIDSRYVIAEVDASGTLSVPSVYEMPLWQPGGTGAACYTQRPVEQPIVDRTRSAGDQRWLGTFDISCSPAEGPSGCAPPGKRVCPLDTPGLACPGSGLCQQKYCERPFFGFWASCTDTAGCGALGECKEACLPIHPTQVCVGGFTPGLSCFTNSECWGGQCACAAPGKPAQEFSFDGSQTTTRSRLFQQEAGAVADGLVYDSGGSLWMMNAPDIEFYSSVFGFHSYDATGDPAGVAIVPPNAGPITLQDWNIFSYPRAKQVANTMYVVTRGTLQRVQAAYGSWLQDSSFELTLANSKLPTDARVCTPWSGNTRTGCIADSECPSGTTCQHSTLIGPPAQKSNVSAGGSPASLWMMGGFQGGGAVTTLRALQNLFLLRVPLAVALPDPVVDHRPAIAWNGGDCAAHPRQCRMWAVAPKGGGMMFRVRDDGFWSAWLPLPAGDVGMGPAIVATGSMVEVYARASDRSVKRLPLTSSVQCAPEACTWGAWSTLPDSPWTDNDVAAAAGGGKKIVAMRRAYDGQVHVTLDAGSGWSPWVKLDGLPMGGAPSVTYHPADGKFWIAASKSVLATIHTTTYDGSAPQPWSDAGGAGSQAPWLTAPAIVSDGQRIHVYVGKSGLPTLYQTLHNGAGWGKWRPFATRASSAWQPAVANLNGEIQLLATWAGTGISELASD